VIIKVITKGSSYRITQEDGIYQFDRGISLKGKIERLNWDIRIGGRLCFDFRKQLENGGFEKKVTRLTSDIIKGIIIIPSK